MWELYLLISGSFLLAVAIPDAEVLLAASTPAPTDLSLLWPPLLLLWHTALCSLSLSTLFQIPGFLVYPQIMALVSSPHQDLPKN